MWRLSTEATCLALQHRDRLDQVAPTSKCIDFLSNHQRIGTCKPVVNNRVFFDAEQVIDRGCRSTRIVRM